MGEFMADAARAGVQVIVETHSDHVLNGVRRAVKRVGCLRSRWPFTSSGPGPKRGHRS